MLTIRKLKDDETANLQKNSENSRFYGVIENGVINEYAEYAAYGDTLKIIRVTERTDNLAVIDGLIRTLLFTTDPAAIRTVELPLDYPLTAKLFGFEKADGVYVLKTEDFCNHCKGY